MKFLKLSVGANLAISGSAPSVGIFWNSMGADFNAGGLGANWSDTISVDAGGAAKPAYVTLRLHVDGSLSVAGSAGDNPADLFSGRARAVVSLYPLLTTSYHNAAIDLAGSAWASGSNQVLQTYGDWSTLETGEKPGGGITGAGTIDLQLFLDDSGGKADFIAGLGVQSVITGRGKFGGLAIADFLSTATLTGVFLPDGTTPESHGGHVSFDSGMTSPNLSSVPEPSIRVLLGIGIGVIGIAGRRRR
jgi:hypothetical protein